MNYGAIARATTSQVALHVKNDASGADVASILVTLGDPAIVVPSPIPDDNRPRMAISNSVVGPGNANRQLIARVPFADERAEEILKREAKQLPKDECGLVIVNVNLQPGGFESWSQRVPERFTPGQHTRVAGVILFMHATSPTEHGLAWLPYLRLIANPNAKKRLPSWVLEGVARTRSRTKKAGGQPD